MILIKKIPAKTKKNGGKAKAKESHEYAFGKYNGDMPEGFFSGVRIKKNSNCGSWEKLPEGGKHEPKLAKVYHKQELFWFATLMEESILLDEPIAKFGEALIEYEQMIQSACTCPALAGAGRKKR